MAKRKSKKNNNFVSENKIEETLDKGIEQMETNGDMSEAAMEAEIAAQENPKPDYLDENGNPHWFDEEDYDVGQIPLEVVDRTEMLYANSDKVAAREYKIRIDEGLFKELAPEQYSETSFSDDEIPAITYRQSTDSEVPDQFLISKFKRGDYDIPLIQTTVEIKDEELLKQIKFNVEDYEKERQRTESELSKAEENNTIKEMHDTMYHTNSWDENFPSVYSHSLYYGDSVNGKNYADNVKIALLVGKAKRGDVDAAVELVNESINPEIIKQLHNNYPNAIVCAVDGLEASGHNMIPLMYQEFLKSQGFEIDTKIEQSAKAHHTGADNLDKLLNRVRFHGAVQKGKEYILLDDHIALGGTLRDLKDYIESNGGKVVAITTLTAPEKDYKISLSKENLETLSQYGEPLNGLLQEYGITDNINGLTNKEAAEIIKLLSDRERIRDSSQGARASFCLRCRQIQENYLLNHPEENQSNSNLIVSDNKKEYNNSNLEQSSLDNAAELLKNVKFSPENYKKLLNVINEISEISGAKKIEVPKPEEIAKEENEKPKSSDKDQDRDNDEGGVVQKAQEPQKPMDGGGAAVEQDKTKPETAMFDPTAPIVYGKTVLPSFAVKTEKGLVSIENPIVTGFNKKNGTYEVESGGEKFELPRKTFETLLSDKKEQEAVQARIAEGKTIVFADESRGIKGTEIPEFSLITQLGLKTYKGFVPQSRDEAAGTYTLSNGAETLILKDKDFTEVTAPERWENKFDEKSPAWQKLVPSQYEDYFKLRDNTAANFTHNLSVACREKANSPCDAMRAAKMIIDQMSKDEKAKTQALLNEMAREEKNLNMVIAGIYHEAVKCVPLNEEKIKQDFPDKYIARPMFDTISGDGQKVENDQALVKNGQDRNLRIGTVLKNIDVQSDKLFGKGNRSVHFSQMRVVSASKEGNSITLMDEKNSYIKLPRDTVLSLYKEQQLREMKSERKVERKNSMSISYA